MNRKSSSSIRLLRAITRHDTTEFSKILQENPPDLDLNVRDRDGYPAIICAILAGEWDMVKEFFLHGANIWVYDSGGANVGWMLATSYPDNKGEDKQWLIDFLKSKKYPWPAPEPWQMPKLVKEGKWPPAFVTGKEREESQLPKDKRAYFLLKADRKLFDEYIDLPRPEREAFKRKYFPEFYK
ncbi:ankyrin repeat domain-containing protein [Acetobacteraceae bacterium]|nr:ankyrin repeat domain-containing protein [Acetobacteraceae bacterium]